MLTGCQHMVQTTLSDIWQKISETDKMSEGNDHSESHMDSEASQNNHEEGQEIDETMETRHNDPKVELSADLLYTLLQQQQQMLDSLRETTKREGEKCEDTPPPKKQNTGNTSDNEDEPDAWGAMDELNNTQEAESDIIDEEEAKYIKQLNEFF